LNSEARAERILPEKETLNLRRRRRKTRENRRDWWRGRREEREIQKIRKSLEGKWILPIEFLSRPALLLAHKFFERRLLVFRPEMEPSSFFKTFSRSANLVNYCTSSFYILGLQWAT